MEISDDYKLGWYDGLKSLHKIICYYANEDTICWGNYYEFMGLGWVCEGHERVGATDKFLEPDKEIWIKSLGKSGTRPIDPINPPIGG
jgi:hypothetical protein